MPKTRSECIAKTVKFYPTKNKVPEITQEEAILVAATNLTEALRQYNKNTALTDPKATNETLNQLADIFLHKARLAVTKTTPIQKAPLIMSKLEIRVNILDKQHNDTPNNSPAPNIIEPELRVKSRHVSTKQISENNYRSISQPKISHATNTS